MTDKLKIKLIILNKSELQTKYNTFGLQIKTYMIKIATVVMISQTSTISRKSTILTNLIE